MFRRAQLSLIAIASMLFTAPIPDMLASPARRSLPPTIPRVTSVDFGNGDDVRFYCISATERRPDAKLVQVFQSDAALTAKIDVDKPMAFLVHGWLENVLASRFLLINGHSWAVVTIQEWQRFGDTNVCGVDWNWLAGADYLTAALRNIHLVGYWLAKLMLHMNSRGIPFDRMSVAGHSLGAHIAGLAGKNVKQWTAGQQIGTIFGLDPAGPLFTFPFLALPQNALQPSDAEYVQVLHTSAYTYGESLNSRTGTASFTISGGIFQPKCATNTLRNRTAAFYMPVVFPLLCDHMMAVEYFRLSLNPQMPYVGQRSSMDAGGDKLLGMLLGSDDGNRQRQNAHDRFGIHTNRSRGQFELRAESTPPYCTGC